MKDEQKIQKLFVSNWDGGSQMVGYTLCVPPVKLLKHGTLKSYPGFPHGMPTTHADRINADLLAFVQKRSKEKEAAA